MTFTEIVARVAYLRFAGVKPQLDGLYPIAVTLIEFDTLLQDQNYQIATMGHDHRPANYIGARDYIACEATGVAFYIIDQGVAVAA